MATAIGKNAPKYGARHPSCSLKHAIKFQQKCWWNRNTSFASFTFLPEPLRIVQIVWWNRFLAAALQTGCLAIICLPGYLSGYFPVCLSLRMSVCFKLYFVGKLASIVRGCICTLETFLNLPENLRLNFITILNIFFQW